MPSNTPPATKMVIDFIDNNGKVITSHPFAVKAEGDLIGAVADAYTRLHREHPNVSGFDVELILRKAN